jgi:hypothetical protein
MPFVKGDASKAEASSRRIFPTGRTIIAPLVVSPALVQFALPGNSSLMGFTRHSFAKFVPSQRLFCACIRFAESRRKDDRMDVSGLS